MFINVTISAVLRGNIFDQCLTYPSSLAALKKSTPPHFLSKQNSTYFLSSSLKQFLIQSSMEWINFEVYIDNYLIPSYYHEDTNVWVSPGWYYAEFNNQEDHVSHGSSPHNRRSGYVPYEEHQDLLGLARTC